MAKTYWVGTYRAVTNPDKLAAYAQLAGPAIAAGGGKFLVRGVPAKTYEAGLNQRMIHLPIRRRSPRLAMAPSAISGWSRASDLFGNVFAFEPVAPPLDVSAGGRREVREAALCCRIAISL